MTIAATFTSRILAEPVHVDLASVLGLALRQPSSIRQPSSSGAAS